MYKEKIYYWYFFCFFNSSLVTRFTKICHQWGVFGDVFWQTVSPVTPHWWHVLPKCVTNEGLLVTRFGRTASPMRGYWWRGKTRHQLWSHRWRKFGNANFFRHQLDFFRVTNEEFWHSANKWCIFWKELWLIYQSWTEAEKTRRNFKGLHKCWISWPSTSP